MLVKETSEVKSVVPLKGRTSKLSPMERGTLKDLSEMNSLQRISLPVKCQNESEMLKLSLK